MCLLVKNYGLICFSLFIAKRLTCPLLWQVSSRNQPVRNHRLMKTLNSPTSYAFNKKRRVQSGYPQSQLLELISSRHPVHIHVYPGLYYELTHNKKALKKSFNACYSSTIKMFCQINTISLYNHIHKLLLIYSLSQVQHLQPQHLQ